MTTRRPAYPSDAPEFRRADRRRLRKERLAAGLCARCGIDPTPPGTRCAGCREERILKRLAIREPLWPSSFGAA